MFIKTFMTDEERDAPVVAEMRGVFKFPASSNLSAGDGAQILVPGRKRLPHERGPRLRFGQ